ncbi:MAG: putative F0F1-ATPase [candidate division WS2 bacterium ADurb.Bin280]|uniref:Putative F0F1-ATPase n=1 Tax=candidate division WS2 bacterium ADurb.Bin280 TaxID=1852829 RepID=A0A1V5SCL0_9BACT|nr:MAG: putative F0F1-ATPase [candidate division WS2 bacterium ADurb.Bin280]
MKKSIFFSFSLIGQVGLAVAIPTSLLAFLGNYIDQRIGSSPKFLLGFIALSMLISYFSVRKIAFEAIKKMQNIK